MTNPIYNMMNQSNMFSALQNFKKNPMQFLMQKRFNIPKEITNDPNAIIQHLMQTGQVSQQQYNKAVQMARQFR